MLRIFKNKDEALSWITEKTTPNTFSRWIATERDGRILALLIEFKNGN